MKRWIAPENDWRGLTEIEPEPVSIGVVLPVHERVEALTRVLAALDAQKPDAIVVVDDGSEADITAAVSDLDLRTPTRVLRQERRGMGAARARNAGAEALDTDVVAFLDADCVPDAGWVAGHRRWHGRASNLVVAGPRVDTETDGSLARYQPDADRRGWRATIRRRTKGGVIGDLAYRYASSGNVSVSRPTFRSIGGFPTHTEMWGGEDTEFAWQAWNAGAFFIPDLEISVQHLFAAGEERSWRSDIRHERRFEYADRIPHRFYRRGPTPDASIPKVSLLVPLVPGDDVDVIWGAIQRETFADREIWLVGPAEATSPFARLVAGNRVHVAANLAEATTDSRGEYIAVSDPRTRRPTGLITQAVSRLESDKRAGLLRVSYRDGGTRFLRAEDLEFADREVGRAGMPLFAMARRRELMKDPDALSDASEAFATVRARERFALSVTSAVETDGLLAEFAARLPRGRDAAAVGPTEAARAVRSALRRSPGPQERRTSDPDGGDTRTPITYIGYTGGGNMGDEAVFEAVRGAMPWARIERELDRPAIVMLGGGTLVNGNGYYLTRVLREDRPDAEKAVFGVGVRDPRFHGTTERLEDWWPFFDAAEVVGVRGPDSLAHLRSMGYRGDVEVLGDPALLLDRPPGVERRSGRIVVCPVWTGGNLVGGDDGAVFDAFSTVMAELVADGREVIVLSAFPHDDRHLFELMRRSGNPSLPLVAGYDDLDAAMELIASAEIVVAERLHAAIMATAAGTPWVGIGYWPKTLDFAKSVGSPDLVIDSAGMQADRLRSAIGPVLADPTAVSERLAGPTAELRRRLSAAAERLRSVAESL